MPLETGTYISALNASNPASGDGLSQADDHIRLIKSTLKATFPNINGAVTVTEENLNAAVAAAVTDGISKLDDDGAYFASDADTGIRRPADNQVALRAGGTDRVTASSSGVACNGNTAVTGNITATGTVTPTGAYAGGTGQLVPTGTVLDYAGTTEPTGYLFCYGQAVSRTTYSALFAVLSTTFGSGDGSTTFNLPDLRGRVVAGQDDMGGTSANRLTGQTGGVNGDTFGAAGGAETHALTSAENGAHTHTQEGQVPTFSYSTTGVESGSGKDVVNTILASGGAVTRNTTADATPGTTESTGSGAAHNNVQPTLILNKIIKT